MSCKALFGASLHPPKWTASGLTPPLSTSSIILPREMPSRHASWASYRQAYSPRSPSTRYTRATPPLKLLVTKFPLRESRLSGEMRMTMARWDSSARCSLGRIKGCTRLLSPYKYKCLGVAGLWSTGKTCILGVFGWRGEECAQKWFIERGG